MIPFYTQFTSLLSLNMSRAKNTFGSVFLNNVGGLEKAVSAEHTVSFHWRCRIPVMF